MSDKSLPDASFISLGSTYHGIFRLPHGRWRTLIGKGGKPLVFNDAVSATRAAMAKMNAILFPTIRADATNDPDPVAAGLLADINAFRGRRDEERRADMRILRRGDGKSPVVVETKRRGA